VRVRVCVFIGLSVLCLFLCLLKCACLANDDRRLEQPASQLKFNLRKKSCVLWCLKTSFEPVCFIPLSQTLTRFFSLFEDEEHQEKMSKKSKKSKKDKERACLLLRCTQTYTHAPHTNTQHTTLTHTRLEGKHTQIVPVRGREGGGVQNVCLLLQ